MSSPKHLLIVACLCLPLCAWAQFELPGTDIWMLHIDGNQISRAEPLIQRPGYDNQPAFDPTGSYVYYARGEFADDGLGYTDIWRINLDTHNQEPVTRTSTSEFSPTPLPMAPGISVVRVQADGAQQLWSVFPDSERPEQQIVSAEPVGYHAWLGNDSLALFVLGDPELGETNRLELWQPSTDSGKRIASDIGRGLQVNRRGELLYVQIPAQITRLQLNQSPVTVVGLHENGQDFALGRDYSLWHGSGSKLYRRLPGETGWQLMADLRQFGLSGITRIAINPAGNRLAVVVSEQP